MFNKHITVESMLGVRNKECLFSKMLNNGNTIELFSDLTFRCVMPIIDVWKGGTITYFVTEFEKYVITQFTGIDAVSVADYNYDGSLCAVYQFNTTLDKEYEERYALENEDDYWDEDLFKYTIHPTDTILMTPRNHPTEWLIYSGVDADVIYDTSAIYNDLDSDFKVIQIIRDHLEVVGYGVYNNNHMVVYLWNDYTNVFEMARNNYYNNDGRLISSIGYNDEICYTYFANSEIVIKGTYNKYDGLVVNTYNTYREFIASFHMDGNGGLELKGKELDDEVSYFGYSD